MEQGRFSSPRRVLVQCRARDFAVDLAEALVMAYRISAEGGIKLRDEVIAVLREHKLSASEILMTCTEKVKRHMPRSSNLKKLANRMWFYFVRALKKALQQGKMELCLDLGIETSIKQILGNVKLDGYVTCEHIRCVAYASDFVGDFDERLYNLGFPGQSPEQEQRKKVFRSWLYKTDFPCRSWHRRQILVQARAVASSVSCSCQSVSDTS